MTEILHLEHPQITLATGFRAAGVAGGLKKNGALDIALIAADRPCAAAAMFTTNQVKAAPVLYDQELMRAGQPIQAVIINSGNANACTGERGHQDVRHTAARVGDALGIAPQSVFVMSTGVIGQPLPMGCIEAGILAATQSLSCEGGHAAAQAIMTTDTHPKEAAVRVMVGGRPVIVAGMCKGAGMIHPNMATMLALIVTDAAIEPTVLRRALQTMVEPTFNSITVDGDTSTNDTVLLLANGTAGNPPITDLDTADGQAWLDGLHAVALHLAQAIVADGEGASKTITIRVTGAPDTASAKRVAKSIAHSPLVKTAVYGQDANWGRVLCAAGYSGVAFDPTCISLWLRGQADNLYLVHHGEPFEIDEARAAAILADHEVTWELDLGQGEAQATVWTCDLTHAYIDINAHYRT